MDSSEGSYRILKERRLGTKDAGSRLVALRLCAGGFGGAHAYGSSASAGGIGYIRRVDQGVAGATQCAAFSRGSFEPQASCSHATRGNRLAFAADQDFSIRT